MGTRYDADFYHARRIWNQSAYGMQAYLTEGNPQPMTECKDAANRFLSERDSEPRDRGIVLGALGIILMQESAACQQNERLSEAVALSGSVFPVCSRHWNCWKTITGEKPAIII